MDAATRTETRSSGPRLTRRRVVTAVVVVGLSAALWQPVLRGVAGFMHVRSPLAQADFILPIQRDSTTVAGAVAELYRRGLAPRVLLYRTPPSRLEKLGLVKPSGNVWRSLLESAGVPPDAITVLDSPVRNEVDLGARLRGLTPDRPAIRVIVVTSGPFSRLNRNALRQGIDGAGVDLRMHPVAPSYWPEDRWWQSRQAWVTYFDVYFLWVLRLLR